MISRKARWGQKIIVCIHVFKATRSGQNSEPFCLFRTTWIRLVSVYWLKTQIQRSPCWHQTSSTFDHQWILTEMSWWRPVGLHRLWSCESLADCILQTESAGVYFGAFREEKSKSEISVGDILHSNRDWNLHYECPIARSLTLSCRSADTSSITDHHCS